MFLHFSDPSETSQAEQQPEYNATEEPTLQEQYARAANREIDRLIEEQRALPCCKHPDCGNFTLSLHEKNNPGQSLHARARCKKFICPACQRDRIVKNLRRAANVLFHENPKSNRPYAGKHFYRIAPVWQWDAIEKSILRLKSAGRGVLRVFNQSSEAVIVSNLWFPGCTEADALTVAALVGEAIINSAHQKHAFRLLGEWADATEETSEYEVVKHRRSLSMTSELARKYGGTVKRTRRGSVEVNIPDKETAAKFWAELKSCPTLAVRGNSPLGPKSDSGGFDASWDEANEYEEQESGGWDESYDPGFSQWAA